MLSDAEAGELLMRWGRYVRDLRHHGVGYRSESPEGRIKREGGVLHHGEGPRPLPHDDAAEQVETIMVRLRRDRRPLYDTAHYYYVDQWTIEGIARKLRISEETVRKDYLVRVRSIIAGAMSDFEMAI